MDDLVRKGIALLKNAPPPARPVISSMQRAALCAVFSVADVDRALAESDFIVVRPLGDAEEAGA